MTLCYFIQLFLRLMKLQVRTRHKYAYWFNTYPGTHAQTIRPYSFFTATLTPVHSQLRNTANPNYLQANLELVGKKFLAVTPSSIPFNVLSNGWKILGWFFMHSPKERTCCDKVHFPKWNTFHSRNILCILQARSLTLRSETSAMSKSFIAL